MRVPGALFAFFWAASIASVGCGYSLVGRTSNLPESIRIVQFETLVNQTQRVGLEQRLSREIARELASRGRFRVQANAAGADAVLTGAVTGFDLYAVAFDEQGRAKEYQVRITAKVALRGVDEKVIWENPGLTLREDYQAQSGSNAQDPNAFFGQDANALDRLSTDFARNIVTAILEAF